MKRFFALLLMLVLPLQFSYAVASAYCGHEQGVSAKHAGHHQHQHLADAADSHGDKNIPGSQHPDCGQCHVACMAVPAAPMQSQVVADTDAHHSASVSFPPDFFPDSLDRPPLAARA